LNVSSSRCESWSRSGNPLFIGGEFVDAVEGDRIPVTNPHDNSLIAEVAEGRPADVDRAVNAARKAFPVWKRVSATERGRLLAKLADAIEADAENLAHLETIDTGHPIRDTKNLDVPRTVATFRYFAGLSDKVDGRVAASDTGFLNYVTREPVGLIGQIVPWNFPLMLTAWKLGPALAAGNTVVLKPAELTPLTTLRVGQLIAKVGIAPGVVNIVPGYRNTAGQHLAEHQGVDKIAFTGSTLTGRKIVQAPPAI
jgi:acyl-CoA reductase-like NAD-dependent aldehyde dehydrogenase